MKRDNKESNRYKDLLNNCLEIVIVYAKVVNRKITNKAIDVVYIKFCANNKEFELKTQNTNLCLFYLQSTNLYFNRF